jgi:cation:H+ antiporter
MAVGGVVGSIIFNALFVLGTTAVLHPLPFSEANIFDALAVLTATIVLFFALFSGKKGQLGRMEGMLFIAMYFGFIAFAIFRG